MRAWVMLGVLAGVWVSVLLFAHCAQRALDRSKHDEAGAEMQRLLAKREAEVR
jgi:hypothetical protein